MSTSSLSGDFERFSTRADVITAVDTINSGVASLNEDLSDSSPDYDSAVVFSHEPGSPIASPIAYQNAYGVTPERYYFRNHHILNRRLVLGGTAIGEILRDPKAPRYAASKINKDYQQFTYGRPLVHEDRQVGALQYSFTPTHPDGAIEQITEEAELDSLWAKHQSELAHVAEQLFSLQTMSHEIGAPLAAGLEQEDPFVPNAFIVRWDIENATPRALGSQKPALTAYLNQAHRFVSTLAQTYRDTPDKSAYGIREAYDNQGDGAYIVLPIPDGFNTYDTAMLANYRRYTADGFMTELKNGLQEIGSQFHELAPSVAVSGDFGYAEADSTGRLDTATMYALARRQKEK